MALNCHVIWKALIVKTVMQDDTHEVRHMLWKIPFICHLFLSHSGVILCRITGLMQYSRDLAQGGLDVPCQCQFYSEKEECLKVMKELLESASYTTMAINNLQTVKNALKPGDSSTCSNEESIVQEETVETKPKDVCRSMEKQTAHIKAEDPDELRRKIDTSVSSKRKVMYGWDKAEDGR